MRAYGTATENMATTRRDSSPRLQPDATRGYPSRTPTQISVLVAALLVLSTSPGWAAKWDIVPTLSLEETYTDNVTLAPSGSERSEWVTQVIPSILVTGEGTGLRFDARYAPEITYYARGQGDDKIYQRGAAFGRAELVDKLFFFDAGATVDRYNVSIQDTVTTSNINTTGNRATVGTFFASPYLIHDFGTAARAEVRYAYSIIDSNDPSSSQDSTADSINLRLASGPAYRVLSGDLAYRKATIDFENDSDFDSEIMLANARRLMTPTLALLGQVGYEDYKRGTQEEDGSRWAVGFDWTPSPRTSLVATAGDRFFGNSYYVDFRHRTRIVLWRAGYTEDVTTARTEFFSPAIGSTSGYLNELYSSRITDPADRQAAVDSIMFQRGISANLNAPVNFFSSEPFLMKRFQASAAMQGVRNIIVGNIFTESRRIIPGFSQPSSGDFSVSSKIDQVGTSVLWNLQISARDVWNLGAQFTRSEFSDTDRTDDRTTVRLGFTRKFEPRVFGSLWYRLQNNDSNQIGSGYTENSVEASLSMRF